MGDGVDHDVGQVVVDESVEHLARRHRGRGGADVFVGVFIGPVLVA
jgi:hypothetical protein